MTLERFFDPRSGVRKLCAVLHQPGERMTVSQDPEFWACAVKETKTKKPSSSAKIHARINRIILAEARGGAQEIQYKLIAVARHRVLVGYRVFSPEV
jgi:hypothetical protein